MFTYFVYLAIYTSDNLVTDMSVVRDIEVKFDSKENIDSFVKTLTPELNTKLFVTGIRVTNIVIKNFILINEKQKGG